MKAFLAILQYLPYILGGIVAVQQALPGAAGADKKAVILNAIAAAGSVGEIIPEAHVAVISKFIDLTVASLNTTNLLGFGSSKPVPVVPTVPVTA